MAIVLTQNLTKRRMVVERYYEPHALLFDYALATEIASFLSALNAVTFLLAPFPVDDALSPSPEAPRLDALTVPTNVRQCAPEAPLLGTEAFAFHDTVGAESTLTRGIDADPDVIKRIEHCSLPRYLLHDAPFTELPIGYVRLLVCLVSLCCAWMRRPTTSNSHRFDSRFVVMIHLFIPVASRGAVVLVPLPLDTTRPVLVLQLQVLVQDIHVSLAQDETSDVTAPVLMSASDLWTEAVVRMAPASLSVASSPSLKLDNSSSIVRTKHVKLRYAAVSTDEYVLAWEACLAMAQSMSWKLAASVGAARCSQFMDSLQEQEHAAIVEHRRREPQTSDSSESQPTAEEESILGLPASLLTNPVSYLVHGMLATETSACAQCMAPFSFFSRQYECPSCASVVCIPCSRHYVQLRGQGPQVKTCDRCFLREKDIEVRAVESVAGRHGPLC